ncbi:ubiquinone biosynthesis accessory factor UbiJ [Simiduia aestuariiviva]|uniref:Ubiquinone biosynthesis accessory factor UbiJ n=1 Tax=Simiduia aestuariiviva TaxID=1510459 RepID=A0A839UKA7_9GAMM|nr:SCP2 sterol-binding domain-containing protein [Simiduia aestuariiviva]MBB3167211.1 ubiquinone biosynthesis protein UbiJ [Simiduia aestuariiviva]
MLTITLAALAAAESLINEALRYDPATRARLRSLSGKVLHLHITDPAFDIYLCPKADGVDIQSHCEHAAHCKISGKLVDLLKVALGEQLNLAGSGVQVAGQTQLLLALKTCLEELDIDWRDWLAQYLGDELTQPLGAAAERLHRYGKSQLSAAQQQLEPYLSEELQLLPTRTALANFGEAVDQLALAADRLDARLHALIASTNNTRH